MEHARHRPLCPCHCMFGNFGSPFGPCPNSSPGNYWAQWSLPRKFDNMKKPFPDI